MIIKALIVFKNDMKALKLAREMYGRLCARGIETIMVDNLSLQSKQCPSVDLVIVLGGDGTILKAARAYAPRQTPILGVNLGTVGFLSSTEPTDLVFSIEQLIQHNYSLEHRMMINVMVLRQGIQILNNIALNDMIIRAQTYHTINVKLQIDGKPYTVFRGDGVICATPTGSTAYSFSAGGPIIDNRVPAFVITPICPQLVNARSLVLSADTQLEFIFDSDYGTAISMDGAGELMLQKNDRIIVKRSAITAQFIQISPIGKSNPDSQEEPRYSISFSEGLV